MSTHRLTLQTDGMSSICLTTCQTTHLVICSICHCLNNDHLSYSMVAKVTKTTSIRLDRWMKGGWGQTDIIVCLFFCSGMPWTVVPGTCMICYNRSYWYRYKKQHYHCHWLSWGGEGEGGWGDWRTHTHTLKDGLAYVFSWGGEGEGGWGDWRTHTHTLKDGLAYVFSWGGEGEGGMGWLTNTHTEIWLSIRLIQ